MKSTQSLWADLLVKRIAGPDYIKRAVAMTRVEIVLPSERPEIPADLIKAFDGREWADAGGSDCLAIFALDVTRALSQAEEDALIDAWFHSPVLLYRTFTR